MSKARELAELGAAYDSGALSNRNMIINGAMIVSQRNGGSAITPTSDQTATLDRFKARLNVASKYSVQQVADAPSGFYNSLKVTSAAATTPGTNDYYQIAAPLEGYATNVLAQGTSAAKKFTLSFYVKSSLTGTFGGAYSNDLGDRFYAWTYTIDAANTWERKSITITGATDGTWVSTNGAGLHVYWTLGAGSGVQTSAGAWGTTFKRGPTGATNIVATSGATWQITGVQLEVGTEATPFEHRSFGQELALCQRYFFDCANAAGGGSEEHIITGAMYDANYIYGKIEFPVTMRTMPTIVQTSGSQYFQVYCAGASNAIDSITMLGAGNSNENFAMIRNTQAVSFTAGQAANLQKKSASAAVAFDAEI